MKSYQRVVIKLGTSVLTSGSSRLDKEHMAQIAAQIYALYQAGIEVVVCTSGAIAAGREYLNFPELESTLANKQMLAAVGQGQLLQTWSNLLADFDLKIGQLLLTQADLQDRERFLNAKDTLMTLLSNGIIPVINENDAVATAEIKVGDNDNLSARVAILAEADLLLMLTDQQGLFDKDPRAYKDAQLITNVVEITDDIQKLAGGSGTLLGTGGMATKLIAAKLCQRAGIPSIVCSGFQATNITNNILSAATTGTLFERLADPLEQRKQWLLATATHQNRIIIDKGAEQAIGQNGRSLLPRGIVKVEGRFSRGDMLQICSSEGVPLAKGMSRYSDHELSLIKGKHSNDISGVLGYSCGDVAIHRNDLVLL